MFLAAEHIHNYFAKRDHGGDMLVRKITQLLIDCLGILILKHFYQYTIICNIDDFLNQSLIQRHKFTLTVMLLQDFHE